MASLSPSLKEPRTGFGGNGGTHDRIPGGGGGGGGRGDHEHDYGERLKRYRLAVAIALAAIYMLFFAFTAPFVLRQLVGHFDQHVNGYVRDWQAITLPFGVLLFNTGLLVLSSLTLEKARRVAFQEAAVAVAAAIPGVKAADGSRVPWLGMTILLGFGFLGGQLAAWRELMAHGIYMSTVKSSSFFYVITGLHGAHLIGGLLALIYAAVAVRRTHGYDRKRVTLDVTSWYWHSMTVLWIYVLVLLAVVR